MMTTDVRLVFTTFPNLEKARQIGTILVEKQLVACVNLLGGGESIYRWEGKVHCEAEIPAIMKTSKASLEELENAFLKLHPYDVPEFLVVEIEEGSESYLQWVKECCR